MCLRCSDFALVVECGVEENGNISRCLKVVQSDLSGSSPMILL